MQNCPYAALDYSGFDIVVVAASLGGPAALARILEALPPEFPAGIVVAQHVSEISAPGVVQHLSEVSKLPVAAAQAGEPLVGGRVYVAPADQHVLITPDRRLCLTRSPKVKFCRPAAEPLFATAAGTYRERALGVVLTGCNTDGTVGAQTIKWMGGRVLVQDPATARAIGMPRAAIASGAVDYVVPLDKIAAALVALVMVRGVAEYLKVVPTAA
jgi:two-component system, chemotaxis family, protein-glutamate methylesterase/glutaminase